MFKAKSDIISFSKPLAQETSSQLQAQKIFKNRQVEKYYFQNNKCQKKMSKRWPPKDIFKEMLESFQSD